MIVFVIDEPSNGGGGGTGLRREDTNKARVSNNVQNSTFSWVKNGDVLTVHTLLWLDGLTQGCN